MMYDRDFLLQLDQQKNKTIYARITALNLQEYPIESIEGRVTQGSINIDGASAVRRTCSLTIIAQDFDYSNYLWGFNTKFKLEIGVENIINPIKYGDIVWFKQGIYLISSFNTSRSTNNFTITIQGKDKMSMLNGDAGGTINSSVDFGTIEEEDQNGNWVIRKIPIKEIIQNMVHQYGGEPLHNIIINDLPDYGLELMEYRYDVPMYLYRSKYKLNENNEPMRDEDGNLIFGGPVYDNATLDGTIKCIVDNELTSLEKLPITNFEMLVDPLAGVTQPENSISIENNDYIVAKVEYGQTAGYRQTPLTYAGDLIANIGESVTSVLDKIKNMLGEFEYFYDLDGRFIFQQKKSFTNTIYAPTEGNDKDGQESREQYYLSQKLADASKYVFQGGEQTTTFNNNPNIANLRNDYSIWGQRTTISGAQVPIHLRYAIDKIPSEYKSVYVTNDEVQDYNKLYGTELKSQTEQIRYISANQYKKMGRQIRCDWREVLYQMALDYYKYGHLDDFELKVAAANPTLYPLGVTGYEQYYIDLQGFWRQLYDPESKAQLEFKKDNLEQAIEQSSDSEEIQNLKLKLKSITSELEDFIINYYCDEGSDLLWWNKNVYERPETLNFWFDFLDTEGELSQFSVKAIGSRPKAVNDTNIKSIYFKNTPDVLFIKDISDKSQDEGAYKYIQVPEIENMFSISAQGKSAKTRLDELIYQHSYCVDSVTVNCIPIYYLEPNIKVRIIDEKTKLDGDYVVSKITIPLAYNGTMSLTATKASESYLYYS